MIKAYVINLDRDRERWAHVERQGQQLGIAWTRVVAVDKLEEAIAQRAAGARPGALGFIMSAGAIACFESHRKVWRLIVDSGDEYGAVFEDDVVCSQALPAFLSSTDWLPGGCDVAKLETFLVKATVSTTPATTYMQRKVLRLYGRHLGACAYVISRQTAARLLPLTETPADPVDEVLFNAQSMLFPPLTLYQVDPAPCIQGMLLEMDQDHEYLKSSNDRNAKLANKRYRNTAHYLTRKVVRLWGKLLEAFGHRERRRIEFTPD
ncbi:glycosyltransferase family 25 protein [Chelativorans sp.]|uniref:glycosyltransferase family 25 protein n=1 Tax=Chelativorans sp. TaxID=2203393 RepID=UPI0028111534|nr:glycosyltransferase family 25 protein [Chelativorans sp.]